MRIAFALAWALATTAPGQVLKLDLRTRVEPFRGSGEWREVRIARDFPVRETAILICDMWDKHWCTGATRRVGQLVEAMAPVVDRARAAGIQIIHAPSETMDFYRDTPQRRRILAIEKVPTPLPLGLTGPPLPIDDTRGGCDTSDQFYKAWTRQHPAISIADPDVISDQGDEVYSFLARRGIRNLLVMGVHTNMCVLNRTFAIKRMTNWGIRCVLIRDLTDAMYNPKDRPFVSHREGTELVIEYIEKYWCPTALGTDLVRALPR